MGHLRKKYMTAVEETEYERKQRGYVKGDVERNEKEKVM